MSETGARRFVVMGAGEVGRYLAQRLSARGHAVVIIDNDPAKRRVIEEQLDVAFILGNGSHVPTLKAARVDECDLFVASSSLDEANLAASLLAKELGAPHTVVRIRTAEEVTRFGRLYESCFRVDLLLSTQILTTTQILNHVLGFNTLEVEYFAGGALEVRRTAVDGSCVLAQRPLAEAGLPSSCLVLAYISRGHVTVPKGNDQAQPGDQALIIGTPEALDEFERRNSAGSREPGSVVIAGGGATAEPVIAGLERQVSRIKVIDVDRSRAEQLAAQFPRHDIVHGDATDSSLLASEGVADARAFIALTGNDETNLMACLLAEELGTPQLTALVQRSETSRLWQRVGGLNAVSPRRVAAERIQHYIESDYEPHIVSFESGAAAFVQRRVHPQSAVSGEKLANVEIPQGLIVAAVVRDGKASIPRANDTLKPGDDVVLFVRHEEVLLAHLLFPGPDAG